MYMASPRKSFYQNTFIAMFFSHQFFIKKALLVTVCLLLGIAVYGLDRPIAGSVTTVMARVADWQITHIDDVFDTKHRKRPYVSDEWPTAALFVGMLKWAAIADDDTYYEWLKEVGAERRWKLREERLYHADDHCIGQLYLGLYEKYANVEMIAPTRAQFDQIMAEPSSLPLIYGGRASEERWNWCDALFMAPPVWAKLSALTEDPKYLDWMAAEYRASTEFLFDEEEQLFFRDSRFFIQRSHGSKIFWSRGNGWVFGGLALILNELPETSPHYDFFKALYLQMAERLIQLQTDEGFWAMSLLEADRYPTPETSGTGFYCFGLAWGLNNQLLDAKTYEPSVLKAWDALVSCINEEGMLGYVQPIGAEPGAAWSDRTEVYGTGAFLAAGSEVYKWLMASEH